MEYQRHPESEVYPEMAKAEFDLLVTSMRKHGFDEAFPIMLYDGMIVDGWNRYRAANKANVKPVFKKWEGSAKDLRDFILYANSARRHMSKSAHIQALLKSNQTAPPRKRLSDQQIARITRSAIGSVEAQKRIRSLDAEVADKVASGEMASSVADRTILGVDRSSNVQRLVVAFPKRLTERIQKRRMFAGGSEASFVQNAVKFYLDHMDEEDPLPKYGRYGG